MIVTSLKEAEARTVETFLVNGFDVLIDTQGISVLIAGMPVELAARVTFGDPEPYEVGTDGKWTYETCLWISELGVSGDTPEKVIFEIARKIYPSA